MKIGADDPELGARIARQYDYLDEKPFLVVGVERRPTPRFDYALALVLVVSIAGIGSIFAPPWLAIIAGISVALAYLIGVAA